MNRKLYMAPIRGITDSIFRKVFSKNFSGIDYSISPFIDKKRIPSDEQLKRDRQNDIDATFINTPQLLTDNEKFLSDMSDKFIKLGYEAVNLNMACPYPMVTRKKMGAALMDNPEMLDRILTAYYRKSETAISVKIRTGLSTNKHFRKTLDILKSYPIKEIIIHPRTAEQYYEGDIDFESFEYALAMFEDKLVYSGNIFSIDDYQKINSKYPELNNIMLGRGLLMNPFMAGQIKELPGSSDTLKSIKKFHFDLFNEYKLRLSGDRHLHDKMNGIWFYLSSIFGDERNKILKKIKKCSSIIKYNEVIDEIFKGALK